MGKETQIVEGMGAFTGFNGDRYPYTVVKVVSPKKIIVQADSYEVIEKDTQFKEGALECIFTPNPHGALVTLTLRKNGRWVQQGLEMRSGFGWCIGERAYSRNPHF